jgi:hypothetical protein
MLRSALFASLTFITACAHGPAPERAASLTVLNASDFTICDLHAWPDGHGPGRDHLGASRLEPGESFTVPLAPGRYQVALEDCRQSILFARRELRVRGHVRLEFRPIEVERHGFDHRRYAGRPTPGL